MADETRERARQALDGVRAYLETALRSGGVKAVVNENAYERGHRSGLQHALNAIKAELASLPPEPGPTPDPAPSREDREQALDAASPRMPRADREVAMKVFQAYAEGRIPYELASERMTRLLKLDPTPTEDR